MNIGIISTRYARALLGHALERGTEDAVYNNTLRLSQSFREVPELERALLSPAIQTKEKLSLLVTASGSDLSVEFHNFLRLILAKEREALLKSICLVYQDLHNKHHNITICELVTSIPVSHDIEEKIRRIVTYRTRGPVIINKKVDPEIIGGFVFEIGDYRLDSTVRTQLESIKRKLTESEYQ